MLAEKTNTHKKYVSIVLRQKKELSNLASNCIHEKYRNKSLKYYNLRRMSFWGSQKGF